MTPVVGLLKSQAKRSHDLNSSKTVGSVIEYYTAANSTYPVMGDRDIHLSKMNGFTQHKPMSGV